MQSPREGSPRRAGVRRMALWAGLSVGSILPTVGCQVEYAGMTLPSGKYLHDDVQYFPPGPDFPWANTQAATQRARMQAQGLDMGPGSVGPGAPGVGAMGGAPIVVPRAGGALDPTQMNFRGGQGGGPVGDVNQGGLMEDEPVPNAAPVPPRGVNVPGAVNPPPPGNVPAPPPPGNDMPNGPGL